MANLPTYLKKAKERIHEKVTKEMIHSWPFRTGITGDARIKDRLYIDNR